MMNFWLSAILTTQQMGLSLQNQNKTQLDRFREAACEIECDNNAVTFKDRLRQIATPPKKVDKKEPRTNDPGFFIGELI